MLLSVLLGWFRGTVGIADNEFLWDETDGFYYDRSEKTGNLSRIKSIAGFMPLRCGAAFAEQAERLVKEHLINENEFCTPYPVATWSKSEPDYIPGPINCCNWMGTVWIPTN